MGAYEDCVNAAADAAAKAACAPLSGTGNLLPLERWSDTAGFGSNWTWLSLDGSKVAIDPNIGGTLAGIIHVPANFLNGFSGWLISWAGGQPLDTVMGWMDRMVASVYNVMAGSGVLFLLVAIGVALAVLRTRKSAGGFSALVKSVCLGVLLPVLAVAVMGTAAGQPVQGSKDKFHALSPSWTINVIHQFSSNLGVFTGDLSGSIKTTAEDMRASGAGTKAAIPDSPLSCRRYVGQLDKAYQAAPARNDAGLAKGASGAWESGDLAVWRNLRFGETKWADRAWCHWLELRKSNVTPQEHLKLTAQAAGVDADKAGWSPQSAAFSTPFTGNEMTGAMVAWAACTVDKDGKPKVDPDWGGAKGVTDDQWCIDFFTKPSIDLTGFNLSSDWSWMSSTTDTDIQDYLYHIADGGSGWWIVAALISDVSAVLNFALFGAMSLVLLLSSVCIALFGTWLFLQVVISIVAENNKRITSALVRALLVNIVGIGISLGVSLLCLVTAILAAFMRGVF